MFNNDQLDHMQYLSSLPPERKCQCGWNVKWDCYQCNYDELVRRGGQVWHWWSGNTDFILPNGQKVDYGGLCKWLRSTPDAVTPTAKE